MGKIFDFESLADSREKESMLISPFVFLGCVRERDKCISEGREEAAHQVMVVVDLGFFR